ncbi:hypothetical protein KAR91_35625 [Candidatus Pacearchaeota archaeon]|nr:hypothetical protein [Candidatus Pacearchaeota archaeon]
MENETVDTNECSFVPENKFDEKTFEMVFTECGVCGCATSYVNVKNYPDCYAKPNSQGQHMCGNCFNKKVETLPCPTGSWYVDIDDDSHYLSYWFGGAVLQKKETVASFKSY